MKDDDIVPGELLHRTAECAGHYPKWTVDSGVVLSIKRRMVSDLSLGGSDRAMYRARYGYQEKYPSIEIILSTAQGDFLVSQFFFNKDR